jgi:ribonuclease P protein component
VAKTAHFVMHRCTLADPVSPPPLNALFREKNVWVGAMLPKRWAKRSVTRHLIKRQVYAVAAAVALPQAAYVVRLRHGFDAKHFVSASSDALRQAVRAEMHQLFELTQGSRA